MKCKIYQKAKKGLLKFFDKSNNEKWHNSKTLHEKFITMMQPGDEKTSIAVCQFIKSCFIIRKQKQYN